MPIHKISFGRLVTNAGAAILPLKLCAACRNVDVAAPGNVERRKGYQRALTTQHGGTVTLVAKVEDKDGTDAYITIGPDGVTRTA